MPTLAELLKSANVAEDVINGLPKDVAAAIETHLTAADEKFTSATQAQEKAAELQRLADLKEKEIADYVAQYGSKLVDTSAMQAELAAMKAAMAELEKQGFKVNIPSAPAGAKPAVPGSPAVGGNAVIDENAILGKVGSVMEQWFDANNEHIRLFGQPIPVGSRELADEARRNKMSLADFAAKKFNFQSKREEISAAKIKEREDSIRKEEREKVAREYAERNGSNPNVRPGVTSNNSFVPRIKGDEFQKSSGNIPTRERHSRMLNNIHKDLEAAKSA